MTRRLARFLISCPYPSISLVPDLLKVTSTNNVKPPLQNYYVLPPYIHRVICVPCESACCFSFNSFDFPIPSRSFKVLPSPSIPP